MLFFYCELFKNRNEKNFNNKTTSLLSPLKKLKS